MMSASDTEAQPISVRRSSDRRKVLKAARITIDNGRTFTTCTMREISEWGARLQITAGQFIPAIFDLVVELDGMRARCEVIWRSEMEIGVRFCAVPVMGKPLRTQVVTSSTQLPTASLRRTHHLH